MKNRKNEIGHIYGSRVSNNGKWLNLLIASNIDGEEVLVTCPVRFGDNVIEGKPFGQISENDESKSMIINIPVYEDRKPTESNPTESESREDDDSGLPF